MLYKVTGAGHSVCACACVCVRVRVRVRACVWWGGGGVRGSEFSGAWGKREEGGGGERELSFLTA